LKQILSSIALIIFIIVSYAHTHTKSLPASTPTFTPQCPIQSVISPISRPDISKENVDILFKSPGFRNLSITRLAGAVQVPTEDFDDMGSVSSDPRWDVFYQLEKYFKETFPAVHEQLELEIVNEHGLLYTWRGSDPSLKPVMITGHQDVVPVAADTRHQWTYDPFSGYFDGTYVHGRGVHDCKNNVIAIFSAITALLDLDFVPRRTLIVGFGFDEESPQKLGAYRIAQHLEAKHGKHSLAFLLDEGAIGILKKNGRSMGTPQASEKGYMDAVVKVHVPGGHSSMAPPHTSIGILSEVVTTLEADAKKNFPSKLTSHNPFYYTLHCVAEDPHTDLSPVLRAAILDPEKEGELVEILKRDFESDVMIRTSQAVTIFNSGSKANALPQYAEALVNYRISNEQSLAEIRTALAESIKPVAQKHNLTFLTSVVDDHSSSVDIPENTLSLAFWRSLEPSPTSSHETEAWRHFAGVIKHVFDEDGEGNDVLVAPTIAQGNTDTKYYWDLTSQIYRFGPLRAWHDKGWGGIHDVNERVSLLCRALKD
jgi:Gly-Xaa carboxypeptidase